MSEAPVKIWKSADTHWAAYQQPYEDDIPYIRADLVNELTEALEAYITQDEIAEGYGAGIGGETMEKALTALAKARGETQ